MINRPILPGTSIRSLPAGPTEVCRNSPSVSSTSAIKGRVGDRINAVFAAAGYNFGLLLRWLAQLLRLIIRAFLDRSSAENFARVRFFTDDEIAVSGNLNTPRIAPWNNSLLAVNLDRSERSQATARNHRTIGRIRDFMHELTPFGPKWPVRKISVS